MTVNDLVLGTAVGDPNRHFAKRADVMIVMMIHAKQIPKIGLTPRCGRVPTALLWCHSHFHARSAQPLDELPASCTSAAPSYSLRLDFLFRLIHVIAAPHELPAHQPMPTQTTFANPSPPSSSATQSAQRLTSGSRATGQPLWLTPPAEWTCGDGFLARNQLYSFTLRVSVANTPHTRERGMAELDIRDVRLVQAIHGGLSNWLLRPFAHGRFVTWEPYQD